MLIFHLLTPFYQGEAYLACFSCLFLLTGSLQGKVCYSQARAICFPVQHSSVNHPIAERRVELFPKKIQVIYDEGPWQVVLLIPGLAFIPNEDVVYWRTLLWNTSMGCMLATLILSTSYKPFIKNIPRAHLPHNVNLCAGSSSHPV